MTRRRARARLPHLGAEAGPARHRRLGRVRPARHRRSSAPCSARRSASRSPTRSSPTRCTCNLGDRVPIARVRESVLGLRASKGMVLDPADPDSVSAGSFFTNPIVTERVARTLPGDGSALVPRAEEAPDEVTPLATLASTSRRSTSSSRTRRRSRHPSSQSDAAADRAAREALGRVAHRAVGHPPRVRAARIARRDLVEAHARPHEPGRRRRPRRSRSSPASCRAACRPSSASCCSPSPCSWASSCSVAHRAGSSGVHAQARAARSPRRMSPTMPNRARTTPRPTRP